MLLMSERIGQKRLRIAIISESAVSHLILKPSQYLHFLVNQFEHGNIIGMSRLFRYYFAAKGSAQQVKISYYVQDLVTDEFVGKSEGWIHDLLFVQEHQIR